MTRRLRLELDLDSRLVADFLERALVLLIFFMSLQIRPLPCKSPGSRKDGYKNPDQPC